MTSTETASAETIERARRIGREITGALSEHGFKTNSSVRTWSASNVEELRRLPKTSAILGLIFTGGGKPSDAAPHVTGYGAQVVIVGDGVIVLEVAEEQA
jgi:hypothetical protein